MSELRCSHSLKAFAEKEGFAGLKIKYHFTKYTISPAEPVLMSVLAMFGEQSQQYQCLDQSFAFQELTLSWMRPGIH